MNVTKAIKKEKANYENYMCKNISAETENIDLKNTVNTLKIFG